jgi:serine/threonine protein kinase
MTATFELEGFEPISRLGGGGFGDVWLARQTNVDRQVAIKVGHSAIQDETIKLRFDRECKALGRLSGHPNIVDVYTAGSLKDGRPYLVLEYIDGGTLWQRLKKSPIPEPELAAIGAQMASALNEAHSSGVLHRDLKPENILIRSSGEAVLGDFGIARLHDGANTTSAAITASVAYAAPEILSGKRATVASDLYGIGVCLLAAVFRSVPFVQKTDESIHPIINRVLSDRPPDVRRHGVSEGLASLIDRLLAKDPAIRPASAAALIHEFEALQRAAALAPAAPGNVGATQVVTESPAAPIAAPPPNQPAPPTGGQIQTPAQPVADINNQVLPAPRPQDAAPTPAMVAARAKAAEPIAPTPETTSGQISTGMSLGRFADSPNGNMKLFALAYVLTLLIGGLGVFLASRMLGDGDNGDASAAVAGASGTLEELPATPTTALEDNGEGTGAQSSESVAAPLTIEDTSFGDNAEITADNPNPGAQAFCNNAPTTDGLVSWDGRAISTDLGLRSLFQVVSRFETAEQAASYLTSYAATNNCATWAVPTAEGDDIVYLAVPAPAPVLGDDARRFDITGEIGTTITNHTSVILIRSGSDVLALSLSSVSESQVDEIESLAALAAERLGGFTPTP